MLAQAQRAETDSYAANLLEVPYEDQIMRNFILRKRKACSMTGLMSYAAG
jgi:hypothetical protein